MMIAPVIFCTIVLGIGSVRKAATVGKVGGLAFVYFLAMSTFALAIGLVVGNLLHPGSGLNLSESVGGQGRRTGREGPRVRRPAGLRPGHHPDVAVLVADRGQRAAGAVRRAAGRLRAAGPRVGRASRSCAAIEHLQRLVFKVLVMILWLAPIGAFGAIANVVGQTGWARRRRSC